MIDTRRLLLLETGISWRMVVCSLFLFSSWLFLNRASVQWLANSLADVSLFNGVMLIAGLLLLAILGWRYRQQIELAPGLDRSPLLLLFTSGVLAIACRGLISLPQLSVGLFLLGTYGLLGLWLAPGVWKRGLPVGMAIACLLPFGVQFGNGLGAPARIATAHVVEWILHQWRIAAISAGDVIVLDTGVAYVDAPCSGLKSMWTGTLFFLAATWLEGRQIGWRWLAIAVLNWGFLAIANTVRVLVLVLLIHVLQQPEWAEILHVPLGLAGFVTASLLAWLLLRSVPKAAQTKDFAAREHHLKKLNWRSLLVLSGAMLSMAIVPTIQSPQAIAATDLAKLQWSPSIQVQSLELTQPEQKFFASYPGVTTRKDRFSYRNLEGDLVMVASPTWQAHHSPELCLAAMGYQVTPTIDRVTIPGAGRTRWLSLDRGKRSAVYWFQSASRTTDDFISRFWDDVFRRESQWTMVSIVFDRSTTAEDRNPIDFIQQVHQAIESIDRQRLTKSEVVT
jgi:exosortase O